MQFIENTDERNNAKTIFCVTTIEEYLEFVNKKNLLQEQMDNQRRISFSGSKSKIRIKMISDISKGGDIPPIILGILSETYLFDKENFKIHDLIASGISKVFIIDGQHRTDCLAEAVKMNPEIKKNTIILTLLITDKMDVLFERMMVLNIGQTPWDTKQQAKALFRFYYDKVKEFDDAIEAFDFMEHFYVLYNSQNKNSYRVNFKTEIDTAYANSDLLDNTVEQQEKSKKDIERVDEFKDIYTAAKIAANFYPGLDSRLSKAFCYVIKKFSNQERVKICQWFIVNAELAKSFKDNVDTEYIQNLKEFTTFATQVGTNRGEYSEYALKYFFDDIVSKEVKEDIIGDVLKRSITEAREDWAAAHPNS